MSELWELLQERAGHQGLPDELGPDPDPHEPKPEDNPLPALHLTDEDFARAADALFVPGAVIRAVAEVESAGRGFLPDGRPQILYEAHIFHRQTSGRFAARKDARGVALSVRSWDRSLYGRSGAHQHDVRLAGAAALDWAAAHRSCSWGLFQILGTNHAAVGWPRIADFVDAMTKGAAGHLDAFVGFVKANQLDGLLRARNWADFARRYNGPGYQANRYDGKLAEAYSRWGRSA